MSAALHGMFIAKDHIFFAALPHMYNADVTWTFWHSQLQHIYFTRLIPIKRHQKCTSHMTSRWKLGENSRVDGQTPIFFLENSAHCRHGDEFTRLVISATFVVLSRCSWLSLWLYTPPIASLYVKLQAGVRQNFLWKSLEKSGNIHPLEFISEACQKYVRTNWTIDMFGTAAGQLELRRTTVQHRFSW